MNDFVSVVLMQRQRLDSGMAPGVLLSFVCHVGLVCALLAALGKPALPRLRVMPIVPLPMGDPTGLPLVVSGSAGSRPEPVVRGAPSPSGSTGLPRATPKAAPDTPTSSLPQAGGSPDVGSGLTLGDAVGDDSAYAWYLAGVRNKVWAFWTSQVRPGLQVPIVIDFTILEDGSVGDVTVVDSSGTTLLDLAAKRAILTAGPFASLPTAFGRGVLRIRAIFRAEP
jgi:TonB family protein